MSRLAQLQEQLQDTGAAIAQYERAIAANGSPSLLAGLRSVQNRLKKLEADFLFEAAHVGVDVCSYRLFSDNVSRPAAAAIFHAIGDFQSLYSTVYDAIKNGPRKRSTPAPAVLEESTFRFGYCFSGSVGIVLTFDNQQLLLETALDQTMRSVFDLAKSKSTEEVLLSGQQLGPAAIKAMHQWAKDHIAVGLGADIEWLHGRESKGRLMLQLPELRQLAELLGEASEPMQDTVTYEGTLVGTETEASRRFHFVTDDGREIRGPFVVGVISAANPAATPAKYSATFSREFKRILSTGEDSDEKFTLTSLRRLSE